MNIDYKLIGKRIKEKRNEYGITQAQLAEKLDVSIGYISQVERGITKISLDLLGSISSILCCDVSYFVTESAIDNNNYMSSELLLQINELTSAQKKMLIEFIKILQNY